MWCWWQSQHVASNGVLVQQQSISLGNFRIQNQKLWRNSDVLLLWGGLWFLEELTNAGILSSSNLWLYKLWAREVLEDEPRWVLSLVAVEGLIFGWFIEWRSNSLFWPRVSWVSSPLLEFQSSRQVENFSSHSLLCLVAGGMHLEYQELHNLVQDPAFDLSLWRYFLFVWATSLSRHKWLHRIWR